MTLLKMDRIMNDWQMRAKKIDAGDDVMSIFKRLLQMGLSDEGRLNKKRDTQLHLLSWSWNHFSQSLMKQKLYLLFLKEEIG